MLDTALYTDRILEVLNIVLVCAVLVLSFSARKFLPKYLEKRAENLATKADIGSITHEIEQVKTSYLAELERLKTDLAASSDATIRKRIVYNEVVQTLAPMMTPHKRSEQLHHTSAELYASLWLWGSDPVLQSVNAFIEISARARQHPGSVTDADLRIAYARCVSEMRSDGGYPNSNLSPADYRFS